MVSDKYFLFWLDFNIMVLTIVSTFYRTWKAVWVKDKGPGWQQQQRTYWDILSTSNSLSLMRSLGIKKVLLSLYLSSLTQLQVYTKVLLLDASSVRIFPLNPIVLFPYWFWAECRGPFVLEFIVVVLIWAERSITIFRWGLVRFLY